MALDPGALVALVDAAKWARGTLTTDADDDFILELLINSKSRAIADYCDRQFAPKETQDAARTYPYDGCRVDGEVYVPLASDLREVTSVVLAGVTLTAYDGVGCLGSTEYRLEPLNKEPEKTWTAIALGSRLEGHLVVTGKWGCDAVPAPVREVCLEEVAAAFRNPELAAARAASDMAITFGEELADLSLNARRALRRYRRGPLG